MKLLSIEAEVSPRGAVSRSEPLQGFARANGSSRGFKLLSFSKFMTNCFAQFDEVSKNHV